MEVDQETVKRQPQLEVRRERRRPLVMPDTFSGDGKFDDWKEHFENVAAVNSWTDDEKLLWLKVRLTGKAQKAFKRLGDADRVDYKKAMKALLERFEPASKRELYVAEFQVRRKKKTESWADFADDLMSLADKATPNQLVVSHPPLISARMYFHQHQHNTKVYRLDFWTAELMVLTTISHQTCE